MLLGKKGLVFGVTNKNSIGWAVACAWRNAGADVSVVVQEDRFKSKLQGSCFTCDVTKDADLLKCKNEFVSTVGSHVDMIMHSIAYAPKESLRGNLMDCTREDFATTMDISVFSFLAIARAFHPLMSENSSLMCMTYDGSARTVPGYGLMGPAKAALETCTRYLAMELGTHGIRVNGISAGPINTLAARGIANFHVMKENAKNKSPLGKNVSAGDVGDMAAFLASDASKSITGQILYVDAGHSIVK